MQDKTVKFLSDPGIWPVHSAKFCAHALHAGLVQAGQHAACTRTLRGACRRLEHCSRTAGALPLLQVLPSSNRAVASGQKPSADTPSMHSKCLAHVQAFYALPDFLGCLCKMETAPSCMSKAAASGPFNHTSDCVDHRPCVVCLWIQRCADHPKSIRQLFMTIDRTVHGSET